MSFNIKHSPRVLEMLQSGNLINDFFNEVEPYSTGVANIHSFNPLANSESFLPSFSLECINSAAPNDLNAEEIEELNRGAIKFIVNKAIPDDIWMLCVAKMGYPSGEYCLSFPCPTFVMVKVKGKPKKASIPIALRNRTLMLKDYLIMKLGFVQQNTEISYTWEKDGILNIFFKCGAKEE
jgi:hypothetical protein